MTSVSKRGVSFSVLVALLIPVLLLCMGLAVDGAGKAAANRQAEAAAAQAARAGADAAAPYLLTDFAGAAAAAEQAALAVVQHHPGMTGQASVDATGALLVTTSVATPTVFLGLVGVNELVGRGSAGVQLRERAG